ncbi:cytochrome b5 domain-containing protein 1 [Perca fluviatilis]|uniref:cytochrome b5 domain-containing protein 1 n=1 Tax=Perca fluviatilis TaxID=8168 RepID=UPI00196449D7|nr:cytochrome b5 domain-containing protein 1 [Perca fluviatilis]
MKRPKYFTPAEVAEHNTAADLWVSFLGKVCDLTPLMEQHKGEALLLPIMECAGKDISSWFDPATKDVLRYVDPVTSCVRYYTPRGRFLHVPPAGPRSDWAPDLGQPWWRDQSYQVGQLSSKTRWVRVINTLTGQEQRLQGNRPPRDTLRTVGTVPPGNLRTAGGTVPQRYSGGLQGTVPPGYSGGLQGHAVPLEVLEDCRARSPLEVL